MANIRRWNDDREWGFTEAELAAVDLTPRPHPDPLVVDLIAVYLPDQYRGDDGTSRNDMSGAHGAHRACARRRNAAAGAGLWTTRARSTSR
jgi:hypothetical protein